jgi:formate hydrogenlyase transcriptional activator
MCSDSGLSPHSRSDVAVSRYQALFEMADTLAHQGSLPDLLTELGTRLKNVVVSDFINFAVYDEARDKMLVNLSQRSDSAALPLDLQLDQSVAGWIWQNQKPLVWSESEDGQRFPSLSKILRGRGIHSFCALPLSTPQRRLGAVGFGTVDVEVFGQNELDFLSRVAELVAMAMDNTYSPGVRGRETEAESTGRSK